MNFCMSFWSGGYYKEIDEYLVDIHRLSAALVKKNYGQCRMITDSKSKHLFEDAGFTQITTELDSIPVQKSANWALGKLYAYRTMVNEGNPFCHIDYDVFLWNRLPEELLDSAVFCQCIEDKIYDAYSLALFQKHHVNRHFVTETDKRNNQKSYNVGIFGGNNLQFIGKYADEAIEFSLDSQNEECYRIMSHQQPQSIPCISEQYALYLLSQKMGVPVSCLLKKEPGTDEYEQEGCSIGYTHLMGFKSHPKIRQSIYLKLYEMGLKEIA